MTRYCHISFLSRCPPLLSPFPLKQTPLPLPQCSTQILFLHTNASGNYKNFQYLFFLRFLLPFFQLFLVFLFAPSLLPYYQLPFVSSLLLLFSFLFLLSAFFVLTLLLSPFFLIFFLVLFHYLFISLFSVLIFSCSSFCSIIICIISPQFLSSSFSYSSCIPIPSKFLSSSSSTFFIFPAAHFPSTLFFPGTGYFIFISL